MGLVDKFRVQAPSRADLAGGTLDLWPLYCLIPQSRTLNVALDLFATVDFEVFESNQFEIHFFAGHDKYAYHSPWDPQAVGTVPASLQFPVFVSHHFFTRQTKTPALRVNISLSSAVPMGSGLGGSSTLLVALGRGLSRLTGDFIEQGWQWRFLDWAKDTEAAFLKMPTGTQDYLAAIFGGLHGYQFELGKTSLTSFSSKALQELNERMLIVFSGERHHSGLSNWEVYKKAVEGDSKVLGGLHHLSQIAKKTEDLLNKEPRNWVDLGRLLDEEWKTRKSTFEVSTPGLDRIIDTIKKMDVLGVKVCGAAQGGSLLVLVEPPMKNQIKNQIKQAQLQVLAASATSRGVSISEITQDVD